MNKRQKDYKEVAEAVAGLLRRCEESHRMLLAELQRYLEGAKYDYMNPNLDRLCEVTNRLSEACRLPDGRIFPPRGREHA